MKYQYTIASDAPIALTMTVTDLKHLDNTLLEAGGDLSSYDPRREIHRENRKAIQSAYETMETEYKCYHGDFAVGAIKYKVKTKEEEDA